jgi:hypothetical protein
VADRNDKRMRKTDALVARIREVAAKHILKRRARRRMGKRNKSGKKDRIRRLFAQRRRDQTHPLHIATKAD